MSRIKIEARGKNVYQCVLPVRIADINYGNHVGNDSFVSMTHEARVQWLTHNQFSELNIQGVGLIMAALAVEFKKEVFYGDTVIVALYAEIVSKAAFNLYYEMNVDDKPVCMAKTEMVCYNYLAKKVTPMPPGLLSLIQ